MPKYTIKDVIIDPEDPRLDGAIGKECYFGNETQHAIEDANENNNLAILEQVDSSRPTSPFCLYMPSYNDRFSVTCIILNKEEQMPEYTYKDIIIDPASEEAKNCIGKMVYYSDNPSTCLSNADNEYDNFCDTLLEIDTSQSCPFVLESRGTRWQCIIPKKEEPKPELVPFESSEEFIEAWYTTKVPSYRPVEDVGSSIDGSVVWLKYHFDTDETYAFKAVTEIWNDGVVLGSDVGLTTWKKLLECCQFVDGTPCGKLKEVKNEQEIQKDKE